MSIPTKTIIEVHGERLTQLEEQVKLALHRCEYLRQFLKDIEQRNIEWEDDD